ncbi:hypothetical protein ABK040_009305 [Willaertia magna]
MYIKSVIIQGFKSYRDQNFSKQEFSPFQNIIVGRNGSGKSNFFSAISFVLSEKYSKLRSEERQAFLHEGTGRGVISAFVEIIFDNSDNRLPIDKKEVAIRRTIGLKKDEYRIDGKAVSQREVFNLLESAGLSSSNPYYIVEQGKVSHLTTMKDSERLELLKEIAGTKVYDQRRSESMKIMQETDQKKQKINEVIEYVEQRLDELEKEKKELKEFQTLDKERRCIEYAIFDQELNEAIINLEKIEKERQKQHEDANQLHMERLSLHEKLKSYERDIKQAKLEKEDKQKERDLLETERQELIKTRAKLELEMKDSEQQHKEDEKTRESIRNELSDINTQIEEINRQLQDEIIPEFERLVRQEKDIREQKYENERRMNELYSKQGRKDRFNTAEERDNWLRQEIAKLERTNNTHTDQINTLNREIKELKDNSEKFQQRIKEKEQSFTEHRSQIEGFQRNYSNLKEERDNLTNQKKELWKKQSELEKEIQKSADELNRAERKLEMTFSKVINTGIHSVKNIVRERNIVGVYGTVIELITCNDKYNRAVEVTVGNSLFHLVVENEKVASEIIEAMNNSGAQGRVTFIPLNRISVSEPDESIASNEFAPLWKKVKADDKFEKVIKHLFGKTYVCKDLDSGSQFARDHNVNCVTLSGDQANRKGTLTGGFVEQGQSRLENMKQIQEWRKKNKENNDKFKKLKSQISELDDKLNTCMSKLHKVETELHNAKNTMQQEHQDLQNLSAREKSIREALQSKEISLQNLQSIVKMNNDTIESYTNEIGTSLHSTLTNQEKKELNELSATVTDQSKELLTVGKRRIELETKKETLQNLLNTNLIARKNELELHLEQLPTSETAIGLTQQQYSQLEAESDNVNRQITEITKQIRETSDQLDDIIEKLRTIQEKMETEKVEENEKLQNLQSGANSLEKLLNKRKIWTQKKEDCIRQIKELGTLPSDYRKYKELTQKELLKKLHQTNEKLKKFGHVNKKALDQYEQFSSQREEFLSKKDELDKSAKAIEDLIQVLDRRKDEAIERTFKQVAKNFKEIFQTLVPGGKASLTMKTAKKSAEDEEEMEEEEEEDGGVEQYTGVSIKVSFMTTGETEEEQSFHLMQQLSGGQKSLVALCLIFAIQRCDPAPFYLFDEIDAALDAAYRTSVARMIQALSEKENIQFITATFKPEMLDSAENFYGIAFKNKVSSIRKISKTDALNILQEEEALQAPGGEQTPGAKQPAEEHRMEEEE